MIDSFWMLINKLTNAQGLTIGLLLSLGISFIDGSTGYEVSFSFFYLIPMFLVAWTGTTISVWTMAVVDATLWQASNYLAEDYHSEAWIYIWDAASRGIFFVVTGLLVFKIKILLQKEMKTSREDPLTKLLNRRGLEHAFELESARYVREPMILGLIAIDLDNFKKLNDTGGHAEGDKLLLNFAAMGHSVIRPTDLFARIGGDEFVILISSTEKHTILEISQRLQDSVKSSFIAHGWPVSLSQGISLHTEGHPSLTDMIGRADKQLYRAKSQGRSRICIE
jgi:diguanylate cyclase (GGDEF)-like protein